MLGAISLTLFGRRLLFRVLLCVAAIAAAPGSSWALDPGKALSEYSVAVWGPRDGLTGAAIRTLDQSPDGYLWVTSYGAAIRFDGERMVRVDIVPPHDLAGAWGVAEG